jgi:cell division protein FtsW
LVLEFYFLLFFVLVAKAFPDSRFFSRVTTWESRIENFSTEDEDDYQIEKAKIAIASGKFMDLVLGKVFRRTFAAILV